MTQKQTDLRLIRMSEVEIQEVQWLWHPYIPRGKLTIIQGNPGEGKTTLALWLAALCSRGQALPGMDANESINILYQTAEDGLGDTIKPRLMSAGADLARVLCIDETERSLSLLDSRIEQAVKSTNAKLLILDPLQGYLGRNVDMNRANEIRDVLKRLTIIADQTGCAIVLIGHLNKAVGANSAYRGLGSMDFRAAARSVLLVGRMRKDPHVRVIVHDKSSLAPEGKSIAFSIDDGAFRWVDGYNKITAEDLLNGGPVDSKVDLAERLIQDRLIKGDSVPSSEMFLLAKQAGISKRTLKVAKKNLGIQSIRKGLENNKLKGVRGQLLPIAFFYAVLLSFCSVYILCTLQENSETLCILALLPSWIGAQSKLKNGRPIFRPCQPVVAVLRARRGSNRSPPGEGPYWATQGRFCASRHGRLASIFFLCLLTKAKGQTAQPTVSYKKPPP